MHKLPQVLINVRVGDREAGAAAPAVQAAVALAEAELGETGRVLLRPSGTEPLVRVMVEAATEEQARAGRRADRRRGTRGQPGLIRSASLRPGLARLARPGLAAGGLGVRAQASFCRRRAASSMTSSRLQKANRIRWRPASWWS